MQLTCAIGTKLIFRKGTFNYYRMYDLPRQECIVARICSTVLLIMVELELMQVRIMAPCIETVSAI